MPGLSAGTAETGEPVREEGLAAGPWRGRRLQVGWGQGTGLGTSSWGWLCLPMALPAWRCLMPARIWVSLGCSCGWDVPGMQLWVGCPQTPGPGWGWVPWRSCWASPKAVKGQGIPLPMLTLCPQERGCCVERHHRGHSTRRAGPCHLLREFPRPGRRGRPQRPPLQGEGTQKGTGARPRPLCPGVGTAVPPHS